MSNENEKKINWISILNYFIFSFIGCLSTVYCVVIECSSVVASSIVAIILSVLAITLQDERRFSLAGFAGSFAGMTAIGLISSSANCYGGHFFVCSFCLSLTVAVLYSFSEIVTIYYPKIFFDGFGGRLGFIAFISVLIYLLLFRHSDKLYLFQFGTGSLIFSPLKILAILIAASGGAMASMEIKQAMSSLNENYKVLSVALTGIIGGILMAKIPVMGQDLACAWYAGAFVGMSSYFILMLKRHFFFAGLFCGIFYVLGEVFFVGVGGKLGFLSFISVLVMARINALVAYLKQHHASVDIATLASGNMSNMSVDDDFAQRLVESLMQAKESGAGDIPMENIEVGSFVIGEKEEYTNTVEEENSDAKGENAVEGYEKLTSIEKSCSDFLLESGCQRWFYVQKNEAGFAVVCYKNISQDTVSKFQFSENSILVSRLLQEKRIVGFSKSGIEQNFFRSRISKEDSEHCTYLALFPEISNGLLHGIFFILYENPDRENLAEQIQLLKQYYQYSFSNEVV